MKKIKLPKKKKQEIKIDESKKEQLEQALNDLAISDRIKLKEPMMAKLEKGTLTDDDIESLKLYSNDWLNIKSIKGGIIETYDDRYIKIVEIEPITFLMRAVDEQMDILSNFYSWLKIAPIKLQFRVETTKADASNIILKMKQSLDNEANEKVRARGEELIQHIRYTTKQEALKKRFYIIYEYEGVDGYKSPDKAEIYAEMYAVENTINSFFNTMGNQVIEHNDAQFAADMIYRALNPKSSKTEKLKDRIDRIAKDNFMLSLNNKTECDYSAIDDRMYLAPRGLDFTHSNYVVSDGMYITYLYVRSDGYKPLVSIGWFEEFTRHGEDVVINMFTIKRDRGKTIKEAGRVKTLRNSQARDTFRTQEDSEKLHQIAETAKNIRSRMADSNEDLFDTYIQITIMNESLKELQKKKREIKQSLESKDIRVEDCLMYQEQAFKMSLPLLDIQKPLFNKAKRNFFSSSLASTYMFTAFSLYSDEGICLGIEQSSGSLVIFDPFDRKRFSNANAIVCATTGSGKSFLLMLLAYSYRLKGIPVFCILPEKGHEWARALIQAIGGQYIDLAPSSKDCINILAIKPPRESVVIEEESESLLSKKIHQVITFIQLNMSKDKMDDEEEASISTCLTKMYEYFGITADNDSVYADKEKKILKPMPIMEDFYYRACDDPILSRRIAKIINVYVNGDASNMNGQTNVDLSNKFTVFSVSRAGARMLAPFAFLAIDYCYDTIKADITENCMFLMDEVWKMMANQYASQYVDEIYRIARGYGCSVISATQKVDDLLSNEYGASIADNAKIKFFLGLEKKQVDELSKIVYLTESDKRIISNLSQGQAMLFAGNDKLRILIQAPRPWHKLFETDTRKLKELYHEI
ncbi:MAG: hypothetical protein K6B67_05855 [Lachnospiraceae bacterium]|nr:hypothetical protein [Lachnospiraceae bacterium]